MKLRKFNKTGIQRFEDFYNTLTTQYPQSIPVNILTDPETSEAIKPDIEIEKRSFENRFELAKYLNDVLSKINEPNIEHDKGLWVWLAVYYFDQLCPFDNEGRRKPGERARWIPASNNYQKYYRHLLAGPFRIFRAHRDHPERARVLLVKSIDSPGDIYEQLASRQEIVTNKAIIEAATLMYLDKKSSKAKRGAAGNRAGSARRLAVFWNQFDVTWDLYSMTTDEILSILPDEFNSFKPSSL